MPDRAAVSDNEIEITQEMILEGIRALPWLPSETLDNHPAGKLVSEVYRAMYRCSPAHLLSPRERDETHL
jgi:hypothetical protein